MSHIAAITLAGYPLLYMLAGMYAEVYRQTKIIRDSGEILTDYMRNLIKAQARQKLMRSWTQFLTTPNLAGERTIVALRPFLQQWIDRCWGALTFRATQVLTGH